MPAERPPVREHRGRGIGLSPSKGIVRWPQVWPADSADTQGSPSQPAPNSVTDTSPPPATSRHPACAPAWISGHQPADPGARLDPSVPHPARIYSYWLGGKDHYSADREAAEEVIRCRPQVVAGARANRVFLAQVVRYLAEECGIRQFIDIGPGLPAPGNTHDVAQAIAPESRIVYVDNDPLVLVHARALLTGTLQGSCDYVYAGLRDTPAVLAGAGQPLG